MHDAPIAREDRAVPLLRVIWICLQLTQLGMSAAKLWAQSLLPHAWICSSI